MGQVEFVLVVSVVVAYLIFTPERLVLLRNLILWAIMTWMAWHGYELWQNSPLTTKIIAFFGTGRGLSEIPSLVWNEVFRAYFDWGTNRAADIRQECIRTGIRAFNRLRSLLRWTPVNNSTISDEHKAPSSLPKPPAPPPSSPPSPHPQAAPAPTPAPPRHSKYYAILLTTPPVHAYGVASDKFCTPPDRPSRIPWNSTDTHLIPSMFASLVFRRHFALCLVLKEVWESKSKTLAEKFENQLFWDHCGNNFKDSRGATWSPRRIAEVNAIEELDIIASDGNATDLCTKLYDQLRNNWYYRNIWWNDADFSLILACLLVDGIAAPKCAALMHQLAKLREIEVTRPRARASRNTAMAGAGTFIGSWVLTLVTGGAALPVTGPAMIGSWGVAMASGITGTALENGDNEWRKHRKEAQATLQARFPHLRQLFS